MENEGVGVQKDKHKETGRQTDRVPCKGSLQLKEQLPSRRRYHCRLFGLRTWPPSCA